MAPVMVDRMALCKERRRLLNQCVAASVKVKPSTKFGNNVDFPWTNGWAAGTTTIMTGGDDPEKMAPATHYHHSPQTTGLAGSSLWTLPGRRGVRQTLCLRSLSYRWLHAGLARSPNLWREYGLTLTTS
jgi:hypothetical protein